MRNKVVLLLLCLLLLLMISSCKTRHSAILEDTSCKQPCWKNIYPGVTTVDSAIQILENIEEVYFPQPLSEADLQKGDGHLSWLFTGKVSEVSGSIHFQDDLVSRIEFDTDGITLGGLIDKLGNPNQFLAVSGWADAKWLNVYLLYPSRGVIVTYYKSNIVRESKGKFDLTEDLMAFSIDYFDPDIYNDVFKTVVLNKSIIDNASLIANIKEWRGFGTIDYFDPEE